MIITHGNSKETVVRYVHFKIIVHWHQLIKLESTAHGRSASASSVNHNITQPEYQKPTLLYLRSRLP